MFDLVRVPSQIKLLGNLFEASKANDPRCRPSRFLKPAVYDKSICEPTTHRSYFTDSASFSFCRLEPTAHRSVPRRDGPLLLIPKVPPAHHRKCKTTSAGHRQRPPRGGSHARRTHGSSSRHYPAPRRSIHQGHLCCRRSFRPLVPQVVASISGERPRRSLRPDPG